MVVRQRRCGRGFDSCCCPLRSRVSLVRSHRDWRAGNRRGELSSPPRFMGAISLRESHPAARDGHGELWSDALELKGTLDFEGVTVKRGESTPVSTAKGISTAAIPTRISTSS